VGPLAEPLWPRPLLAAPSWSFPSSPAPRLFSHTVWQLGCSLPGRIGIGGEWAMAGTYVAESWPEDRRKAGAGYLQTGYYAGFFLAAGAQFHRGRAMGLARHDPVRRAPVLVTLFTLARVREPARWAQHKAPAASRWQRFFGALSAAGTLVNSGTGVDRHHRPVGGEGLRVRPRCSPWQQGGLYASAGHQDRISGHLRYCR